MLRRRRRCCCCCHPICFAPWILSAERFASVRKRFAGVRFNSGLCLYLLSVFFVFCCCVVVPFGRCVSVCVCMCLSDRGLVQLDACVKRGSVISIIGQSSALHESTISDGPRMKCIIVLTKSNTRIFEPSRAISRRCCSTIFQPIVTVRYCFERHSSNCDSSTLVFQFNCFRAANRCYESDGRA